MAKVKSVMLVVELKTCVCVENFLFRFSDGRPPTPKLTNSYIPAFHLH